VRPPSPRSAHLSLPPRQPLGHNTHAHSLSIKPPLPWHPLFCSLSCSLSAALPPSHPVLSSSRRSSILQGRARSDEEGPGSSAGPRGGHGRTWDAEAWARDASAARVRAAAAGVGPGCRGCSLHEGQGGSSGVTREARSHEMRQRRRSRIWQPRRFEMLQRRGMWRRRPIRRRSGRSWWFEL
jgi:hypothetical protein